MTDAIPARGEQLCARAMLCEVHRVVECTAQRARVERLTCRSGEYGGVELHGCVMETRLDPRTVSLRTDGYLLIESFGHASVRMAKVDREGHGRWNSVDRLRRDAHSRAGVQSIVSGPSLAAVRNAFLLPDAPDAK
jgi:hypothetical protein